MPRTLKEIFDFDTTFLRWRGVWPWPWRWPLWNFGISAELFFFLQQNEITLRGLFPNSKLRKVKFFKCADIHKYVTGVIFHISSSSVSQHAKVMRQQKKIIFKKILPTIPEDQYLHRGMGGRSETENLANVNFIPKMEFKSLVPPSAAHLQLRWKVIVASRKYCTHYWQISTLKDHWRQISTLKCLGDLHPLK